MDKYEEIYVISDIHLGGRQTTEGNFQIFNQATRLSLFIDHISSIRPNDNVALILNGDIFDSLAETCVSSYVALSELETQTLMERLFSDEFFLPVWNALRNFVSIHNRSLIFVIGNHDIEIALPSVQSFLKTNLTDDNETIMSRVKFATTGGGYTCLVGEARVFCTHGNETDPFNWVDYNLLGQLANALNAGRSIPCEKWVANGGTKLVIDVMNKVKENYPFIDTLKPEKSAIAAILMVLDKKTFSKVDLRDIIPVLWGAHKGKDVTAHLLHAPIHDVSGMSNNEITDIFLDQVLGHHLRTETAHLTDMSTEDELFLDAENHLDIDSSEFEDIPTDSHETLGVGDILLGKIGFRDKKSALRYALLDWTDEQEVFDVSHKDSLFVDMEKRVGSDVDYLVTGHTHMPKAIQMDNGSNYFNSGTWIRTYRFTKACLDNKDHFETKIWPNLKGGDLQTLDKLQILKEDSDSQKTQQLLFDRTTAVRIRTIGDKTEGTLLRVIDGDTGKTIELEIEPDSEPLFCKGE